MDTPVVRGPDDRIAELAEKVLGVLSTGPLDRRMHALLHDDILELCTLLGGRSEDAAVVLTLIIALWAGKCEGDGVPMGEIGHATAFALLEGLLPYAPSSEPAGYPV